MVVWCTGMLTLFAASPAWRGRSTAIRETQWCARSEDTSSLALYALGYWYTVQFWRLRTYSAILSEHNIMPPIYVSNVAEVDLRLFWIILSVLRCRIFYFPLCWEDTGRFWILVSVSIRIVTYSKMPRFFHAVVQRNSVWSHKRYHSEHKSMSL